MTLLLLKKKKKEEGKFLKQLSIWMCRSRAEQPLPGSAGSGQRLKRSPQGKQEGSATRGCEGHPGPLQWAFLCFLQSFINVKELNVTGE